MADLLIAVRLKVEDAGKFKSDLRGAGREARRFAGGRGGRDGEGLPGGRRGRRARDPGRELDVLGRRVGNTGLALERSAARTGRALVSVVQPAIEFERAITDAVAVTGDALADVGKEEQLRALTGQFTDMGFTSREVAESIGFMGMAGLQTNQILGSMKPSLDLAKAASLDAGRAIDLGTDVMTSFGLTATTTAEATENMTRVADVLTQTFTSTNTTLPLTAQALFKVGPLAEQAGVSLESTAAAVGVLASAGIKGASAGTALRNVFLRLSAPTAEVKKAFKTLKVDIDDVQEAIASDDLEKAFGLISEAATKRGLDAADTLKVFKQIFGTRAATSAAVLARAATTGEFATAVTGARAAGGTTARISAKKLQSDAAKVDIARARLEEIFVTVGKKVLPQLLPVAEGLLDIGEGIAQFAAENPLLVKSLTKLIIGATLLAGTLGPVLTVFGGLARGASLVQTVMGVRGLTGVIAETGKTSVVATSSVGKLSAGLGQTGLVAAAGAAGFAIGTLIDQTFGISDRIAEEADRLRRISRGEAEGGAKRGAQFFGKDLTQEEREFIQASEQRLKVVREREERIKARTTGITGFVTGPVLALSRSLDTERVKLERDVETVRQRGVERRRTREVEIASTFAVSSEDIAARRERLGKRRLAARGISGRGRRAEVQAEIREETRRLNAQEQAVRTEALRSGFITPQQAMEERTRRATGEMGPTAIQESLGMLTEAQQERVAKIRLEVDVKNNTVIAFDTGRREIKPGTGATVSGL